MRIKPHLSWSQYQCFNQSKEQYIRRYIDGVELQNKYVDFGKEIAEGLKNRDKETDNQNILTARKLIKAPQECEKEIKVVWGKIPILGFLDGFNPKHICEYKTSKNDWTQKMVDGNEQLTFYAIMISEKFKIPIDEIKITLDWLPTFEDIDYSMHLTGEIKSFETKRTNLDKIKIYPKIKKAWIGIEKLIDDLI